MSERSAPERFSFCLPSEPRIDEFRFLDALIYNWLIKGTDAHAKNYGFLIAPESQVRLAPLYDVASFIPYEEPNRDRKVRLAMKIGGEYQWWKIGPRNWARVAKEWRLGEDEVFSRIHAMAAKMPKAFSSVRSDLEKSGIQPGAVIDRLEKEILSNAESIRKLFAPLT